MTHDEIAATVGTSRRAVGRLLARSRRRMQRELGAEIKAAQFAEADRVERVFRVVWRAWQHSVTIAPPGDVRWLKLALAAVVQMNLSLGLTGHRDRQLPADTAPLLLYLARRAGVTLTRRVQTQFTVVSREVATFRRGHVRSAGGGGRPSVVTPAVETRRRAIVGGRVVRSIRSFGY